MANTRSAKKRVRSSARKMRVNQGTRSEAKTSVKAIRALIAQGKLDEAQEAMSNAYRALDQAVVKGTIHANNAARRKARLMEQLNKARASAQ